MSLLVLLLHIQLLLTVTYSIYYAYVSSNGTAFSNGTINNCSLSSPCPNFQHVVRNPDIMKDDEIIIKISGSNPSYASVDSSYCESQISGNVTFIFNTTTIKTVNHWFSGIDKCDLFCVGVPGTAHCPYPLTISENANVKMYNFIWDIPTHSPILYTKSRSIFYCENCFVVDNEGGLGTFAVLSSIKTTFYNSTFTNSIIGDFGRFQELLTIDTNIALNLSYCWISNINGKFITLVSNAEHQRSINIEYCNVSISGTFIYVANRVRFSIVTNQITMESVIFNANIVSYVEPSSQIDIVMNNINISYSQYLGTYVLTSTSTPNNTAIYINSEEATIEINNAFIVTHIDCQSHDISSTSSRRILLATYTAYAAVPFCNSPTPFLFNRGTAELNNITLKSDFSALQWEKRFNPVLSWIVMVNGSSVVKELEIPEMQMYKDAGVYFFWLKYYDSTLKEENEPYFAAIVNNGYMQIKNFYVGIGSHFAILYNNKGDVKMDGIYTEFYDNQSAYYNVWNLRLYTAITNNFGRLRISNSVITGSDISLINIYGGDTSIVNTVLSQSMMGIVTHYKANTIDLDHVQVFEIGQYYASLGAAIYYGIPWKDNYNFFGVAPMHLSSQNITICNSLFDYIGPSGIIHITEPLCLCTTKDQRNKNNHLIMTNNTLIASSHLHYETMPRLPTYRGLNDFSDFRHLQWLMENPDLGGNVNKRTVDGFMTHNVDRSVKRLVMIGDKYQFIYGNNTFYMDLSNFTDYAHLYIDTDTHSNCMASNSFYNIDIHIKSGHIISCKHPKLDIQQNQHCIKRLGPISSIFTQSYFWNSGFVFDASISTVIIDDAMVDNSNKDFIQFVEGDVSLLLMDVAFLQNSSNLTDCYIICHQIIDDNEYKIRQLNMNYNDTSLLAANSTNVESFSFWSPYSLLIFNNNTFDGNIYVFPGERVQFEYEIHDYYGNIIDIEQYAVNVTVELFNSEIPLSYYLSIGSDGVCRECETGIELSGISIDNVNKSYHIQIQVMEDMLITKPINFNINECPSGYGVSVDTLQCKPCSKGQYSLQPNLASCHPCDQSINFIECPGENKILIEYNHWMNTTDKDGDDIIISSDCPNDYCCQLSNRCDYLSDYQVLCALNRDPTIPLCGKCIEGYSELFGSTNCGVCQQDNYHYFWLPLLVAMIFSFYLLCFDHPKFAETAEPVEFSRKVLLKDDTKALSIIISKVFLYFAQGLLFILASSNRINGSLIYYLLPILQIFNFNIEYGARESSGYCLFNGMTGSMKILLDLTIPIFILFLITITLIASKTCCININCNNWMCCMSGRKISYYSAYLKGLLMMVGSVLAVILKVLTCRTINNDIAVHFYFGSEECFGTIWFVALFGLCIIIIFWCICDIKLFQMKHERQNILENKLFTLVNAYKFEDWYWETVLLSRRLFIALLTIISDPTHFMDNILVILLCIYLCWHSWKQPFKYNRANRVETLCIIVLIFVIIVINNDTLWDSINNDESILLALILLISILLPTLLILYEIFKICQHSLVKSSELSILITQRTINRIQPMIPTSSIDHHDDINNGHREEV